MTTDLRAKLTVTADATSLVAEMRRRTTPALRVGPGGMFEWQEGGSPLIEFNPDSGLSSGVRVAPASQNIQPRSNHFGTNRSDIIYYSLTGVEVPDRDMAGLDGPSDPGTAWEFTATNTNALRSKAAVFIAPIEQVTPFSWSIYYKAMNSGGRYIGWDVGPVVYDTQSLQVSFSQGTTDKFKGIVPFIERAPGGYVRLGAHNIGANQNIANWPDFRHVQLVMCSGMHFGEAGASGFITNYERNGTQKFRIAGLSRERGRAMATSYMPTPAGVPGSRESDRLIVPDATLRRFFRPEQGAFLIESTMNRFLNAGAILAAFAADQDNNQITLAEGPDSHKLRAVIKAQGVTVMDETVTPAQRPSSGYCRDFLSYGPAGIVLARNGTVISLPAVGLPPLDIVQAVAQDVAHLGQGRAHGVSGQGLQVFVQRVGHVRFGRARIEF